MASGISGIGSEQSSGSIGGAGEQDLEMDSAEGSDETEGAEGVGSLSKVDANQDGKLSKEELLKAADTNKDGNISQEELQAFLKSIEGDMNGKGGSEQSGGGGGSGSSASGAEGAGKSGGIQDFMKKVSAWLDDKKNGGNGDGKLTNADNVTAEKMNKAIDAVSKEGESGGTQSDAPTKQEVAEA
jgi:EF hand